MQSGRIALGEVAHIMRDRRTRMAAAVIMLVPLLYGALYLWAFWDPYERLDELPVALVNEDVAVTVDGETIATGDALVEQLVDMGTMGWNEVSAEEARAGLDDGTYYLALMIPPDFSENLASANTTAPERAELQVIAHESANLLAAQIGDRVFAEVRAASTESASESYLNHIFLGFSELGDELTSASLGADDLASGLADAQSGAVKLAAGIGTAKSGAGELASGITMLSEGASALTTGANDVVNGNAVLSAGLSEASSGALSLAAGTSDVRAGASDLSQGMTALASGAARAESSAAELAAGAGSLNQGILAASDGLAAAAEGASGVQAGASATLSALNAYATTHSEVTTDADFQRILAMAAGTDTGAGDLLTGLDAAASDLPELVAGSSQIAVGSTALSNGITELASGIAYASGGAAELADGAQQVDIGAASLATGVSSADAGAAQLLAGSRTLAAGTSDLKDGTVQALSGSGALVVGLSELDSGGWELADGLTPAVEGSAELAAGLTAGAESLPDYSAAEQEANVSMMSSPVNLTTSRLDPVPNYGTGFAPYFIPLALWVGALMTFFITNPLPINAIKEKRLGIAVALGGFWPAALIGVAQAVVMLLVLQFGLGLEAVGTMKLYAFTVLSALVFVAVLQWLGGAFGPVGKFLSIVLLMLQLTSSAGTFPLQTVPSFFQVINPFLPMTYVVSGLREAISGGDWAALGQHASALAAFGIGALLLTAFTARRARNWGPERLKPALEL